MNRRKFGQSVVMTVLGAAVFGLTGCSLESVWTAIQKYVPVGLSAVSAIVSILTGGGVVIPPLAQTVLALITQGFGDLTTAVQQYQAAPSGSKSSYIGAVSEVLTVIEANIQKFWANLTIPDAKLAALIEGLLGVITTTLQGFVAALPASTSAAAFKARQERAALPRVIGGTPKRRSLHEFRKDFNALLGEQYREHKI